MEKDSVLVNWDSPQWWEKQVNFYCGCEKVSPACNNCYAKSMVERFKMNGDAGFNPTKHTKAKMPKSGIVFVGNLTDAFGEWVSDEEIIEWFVCMYDRNPKYDLMRSPYADKHTAHKASYIWLTKRPERMMNMLGFAIADHPFAYYGFTAENQEWYDKRICSLFLKGESIYRYEYPYNHWISCEPLIGSINLHLDKDIFLYEHSQRKMAHIIKQVIVGCESGPKRRHCKIEWIEDIVDQCRTAGVPVFVKQIELPGGEFTNDISRFPKNLQVRQLIWSKK